MLPTHSTSPKSSATNVQSKLCSVRSTLLRRGKLTEDFPGDIATAYFQKEEKYDGDEKHGDEHGDDTGEQETRHRIPVVKDCAQVARDDVFLAGEPGLKSGVLPDFREEVIAGRVGYHVLEFRTGDVPDLFPKGYANGPS